jgi:hypothetical protein
MLGDELAQKVPVDRRMAGQKRCAKAGRHIAPSSGSRRTSGPLQAPGTIAREAVRSFSNGSGLSYMEPELAQEDEKRLRPASFSSAPGVQGREGRRYRQPAGRARRQGWDQSSDRAK